MSLQITDKSISEFDDCLKQELLTYVEYPYGDSRRCFTYPRFLYKNNEFSHIEATAFPDIGCLPLSMVAQYNASDVEEKYGNLVIMKINDDELKENFNYPDMEQSRYNGVLDPGRAPGKSYFEFRKLSQHPLSSKLMQVVEIQEEIDFSAPVSGPVQRFVEDAQPQTKLIVIAVDDVEGRRFYGPFECTIGADPAELILKASSDYDLRIGNFRESSFNLNLTLKDKDGYSVAQFISADEFKLKFDSSSNLIDWISDDDLLNALKNIARNQAGLSKNVARKLETTIRACAETTSKVKLDDDRKERLLALVSSTEAWVNLPDEMKLNSIEQASPEQVAKFVLENDQHFSSFYKKAIENQQVKEKVDQEVRRYRAEEAKAKESAESAKSELAQVQEKLADLNDGFKAKQQELEESIRTDTEKLRQRKYDLEKQVGDLKKKIDTMRENEVLLKKNTREIIQNMSDEVQVSSKILESNMVNQVVSALMHKDDEDDSSDEQDSDMQNLQYREGEEDLSSDELIDEIYSFVTEDAGRDYSINEVINMMICITQGYVTTFAGLPGTGKTSLANILASAIGLTSPEVDRYVEVPVERGWTSYKDFIGYYNPFSKEMEKSNVEVFDAFQRLNFETKADNGKTAPFMFLLDEANLSSIEHYWSPFLHACDSFNQKAVPLSLGGAESFSVPEYVRFIATVNFDHTTEELSARFLDRSWVITLDPNQLDFESSEDMSETVYSSKKLPFSYGKLQQTFGATGDAILKTDQMTKLNEVLGICANHRRDVSPRSQKMIRNYLAVAGELLDLSTADSAYAPVDFAVTQKVLPLISGTEDRVRPLLEDLNGISGLPLMKKRVNRMLELGDDSGFYQYFA